MRHFLAAAVFAGSFAHAQATCIRGSDVQSMARPDDKTIVFTMNDRAVYRNDLPVRCPGLHVSVYGITYAPTDPSTDELCDGMVVFHLNDVGHASCIAGKFTRLK